VRPGSRGAPATHRGEIRVLWWIALVVLVLWLLGFLVRVGEGTSRSRWYRW
jgi:hypothetical protein